MADIELVIKLPEVIYKASRTIGVKYKDVIQIPLEVIADGILLPKGHGRLIDADAVLVEPFGNTYKDIDIAETIIEADKAGSEDV